MSYAEADRVWIRRYVGYGAIFLQAEPRLENAITAVTGGVSGVAPGPTSTTGATFNTPSLRGLVQIEATIAQQDALLGASSVDGGEAKVDPVRETARLRMEGRRLCHQLARMLGMRGVRADMFSRSPVIKDDDPFAYNVMQHWNTE